MMQTLAYLLSAGFAGLLFGLGLLLSGMTNPQKVTGFLDITGKWDPSLAFVMGGAVAIGVIGFARLKKRGVSVLGGPIHFFSKTRPSAKVVIGSLIFGLGWGLTGVCPGPGLVNLGAGSQEALVFVVGLLLGTGVVALGNRNQPKD